MDGATGREHSQDSEGLSGRELLGAASIDDERLVRLVLVLCSVGNKALIKFSWSDPPL